MLLHHTFAVQESVSALRQHYLHITPCRTRSTSSEPLPWVPSTTHFQHSGMDGFSLLLLGSRDVKKKKQNKKHVPSSASKNSVVSKIPHYIILITVRDHINHTWCEVSYELSTTGLFFHRTTAVRQST